MRFLLTFLALFTPLAWILWTFAGGLPTSATLDAAPRPSDGEPVLDTSRIPRLPMRGELLKLENALYQRFDPTENYVLYYVSFRGIEKAGEKTRVVGISCAVFGRPVDGRENLRMRMEAPYLEGDPATLLAAREVAARELVLGGGVKVYDGLGRLAAELPRVVINLEDDSVSSEGEVYFRSPKEDAELRGRGMTSDLAFNHATILHDVRARLPLGGDAGVAVTLECDGVATFERDEKSRKAVVTLLESARIEHPDVNGSCGRITAHLAETPGGKVDVEKVVLDEEVTFDLDPRLAAGLEEFHAHRITLLGRTEIVIESGEEPVRAVLREVDPKEANGGRRGPLRVFGLADRTLDIATPRIVLRLRPEEKDGGKDEGARRSHRLESVRFPEGLEVRDREGPGRLDAGWLEYDARGGRLEAKGGVVASAVGRRLEAERIDVRRPPDRKDAVVIGIFGRKSLTLRATGRLGPLARGEENEYTFSCAGPLYLERLEERAIVTAREGVVVRGKTAPILEGGQVIAIFESDEVKRVEASGSIVATDPETKARIECERLDFAADRDREVLLRGAPAVVTEGGRVLRAPTIRYFESGRFRASGGVAAEVELKGRKWTFVAEEASGVAPPEKKGDLDSFLAKGAVTVDGPEGERLEADRVEYTREDGALVLRGKPARVRQGEEFSYEGPALVAHIAEKGKQLEVESARTAGPAKICLTSKRAGAAGRIARWEIDLAGSAKLEKDLVTIPEGAAVRGYDGKGALLLKGSARTTRIVVERTKRGIAPRKLVCEDGIELETFKGGKRERRLEARSLDYVLDTRRLDLQGPGRVWTDDGKEPTPFREAELELLEEGLKLHYLR